MSELMCERLSALQRSHYPLVTSPGEGIQVHGESKLDILGLSDVWEMNFITVL